MSAQPKTRYGATKAAKIAAEAKTVSADQVAAAAATASHAVDAVNPASATGDEELGAEIQIDPQLLAQAVQMRNARLIASMVHENAMLEVALEQERRARMEAEAKAQALQQMLSD